MKEAASYILKVFLHTDRSSGSVSPKADFHHFYDTKPDVSTCVLRFLVSDLFPSAQNAEFTH